MPVLMNVKEASEHFGIDKNVMYDLVKRPDVPTVMINSRRKINSVMFQEWINEMTRKGEVIR